MRLWAAGFLLGIAVSAPSGLAVAQTAPSQPSSAPIPPSPAPGPPSAASYQGSVTKGQASVEPVDLSLDNAIERGLEANLGIILSGTQTAGARALRLSQLQTLLPSVDFNAKESEQQTDLPAEGL